MRKLTGEKLSVSETLLASIVDRLSLITWMLSEDGRRGRNRPKSILSELTNNTESEKPVAFESGYDFLVAREAILKGGE